MTSSRSIWRRRLLLWVIPLAFLLVNLALLSTYRLVYAGRIDALETRVEAREDAVVEGDAEITALERFVAIARGNRERLASLYDERFATERERFTAVTAEIKELAERAGLEPSSISYPEEQIEDYGLVKRSYDFSVQGSYEELTDFLELIELTPSFVTLEEINLRGAADPRVPQGELTIDLELSTLFVREERPRRATAAGGSP